MIATTNAALATARNDATTHIADLKDRSAMWADTAADKMDRKVSRKAGRALPAGDRCPLDRPEQSLGHRSRRLKPDHPRPRAEWDFAAPTEPIPARPAFRSPAVAYFAAGSSVEPKSGYGVALPGHPMLGIDTGEGRTARSHEILSLTLHLYSKLLNEC